jgi:hypothetical protein
MKIIKLTRIVLIFQARVDGVVGGGLGNGLQVVGGVADATFVVREAETNVGNLITLKTFGEKASNFCL